MGKSEELIIRVADRHGHDQRYVIDPAKAMRDLGWGATTTFEVGIKKTIECYLAPIFKKWLEECVASNQEWLKKNYTDRI